MCTSKSQSWQISRQFESGIVGVGRKETWVNGRNLIMSSESKGEREDEVYDFIWIRFLFSWYFILTEGDTRRETFLCEDVRWGFFFGHRFKSRLKYIDFELSFVENAFATFRKLIVEKNNPHGQSDGLLAILIINFERQVSRHKN